MRFRHRIASILAVGALPMSFASITQAAAAPLFQYTFDSGGTTTTPYTSGGASGGVLTANTGATVSAGGKVNFNGTGVTGLAGDTAYNAGGGTYSSPDSAYGVINTTAGSDAFSTANAFTITAWLNLPADFGSNFAKIVQINSAGQGFGNPLVFSVNNQNLQLGMFGTGGTVSTSIGTASSGWHFVAVTWNGAGAAPQASYYTGTTIAPVTAVGTATLAGTLASLNGDSITVGNNAPAGFVPAREFDGGIDDLRIYAGALSLTDLQTVASTPNVNATPEPAMLSLFGLGGVTLLRRRR